MAKRSKQTSKRGEYKASLSLHDGIYGSRAKPVATSLLVQRKMSGKHPLLKMFYEVFRAKSLFPAIASLYSTFGVFLVATKGCEGYIKCTVSYIRYELTRR